MRRVGAAALVVVAVALSACSWTRNGPAEWDLREPVDGNVLELVVWLGGSSCHSFSGVDVDEDDEVVRVTTRVRTTNATECTADIGTHDLTVRLDQPLGDRVLEGCRPRSPVYRTSEDPGANCGA